MVKQISEFDGNEYKQYRDNIRFKYGNSMRKIKNNMYEGILNEKETINIIRKNLYDALIIFCIPIFENEKNITEEERLCLEFVKRRIRKDISDLKINGINEENINRCSILMNLLLLNI